MSSSCTPRPGSSGRDGPGTAAQIPYWMLTLAGLGVFAGCVGKSAQFPLHVWLPDAMAGPTPVSALIHAATMVAAGVYLVGRFYPLFTDDVLLYIAYTGGITLFIAATIAMVQTDYKKVLAYSTVSQLGFMMLGAGRRRLGGGAVSPDHARVFQGPAVPRRRQRLSQRSHLRDAGPGGLAQEDARHRLHDAGRNAGDLGRAVFQRVLLEGRDPGGARWRGCTASPEHFLLFVLPAVGAVDDGFLHVPDVVSGFRRRARGFPGPGGPSHVHDDELHGHDAPAWARRQPGYDHAHESEPIMTWPLLDLGGPEHLQRLDAGSVAACRSASRCWSTCSTYGEPYRAIDIQCMARTWCAMAASLLIVLVGIGRACCITHPTGFPYVVPTRFERGADRPSGSAGFTSSWSTSGISTSCTRPCSCGRAWRWPGSGQIDKLVDRRPG